MSLRSNPARGVALDDLIALNDEIAALARAGMPLEQGLMGVGGDLPGRLGRMARDLGQRMERGETLLAALEAEEGSVPATYRAVVEAGMRSGRLAEALEGLAGFARSYVELRRAIGLALLYPTLVLLVGYGLFVMFLVDVIPRVTAAFTNLHVPIGSWMQRLGGIGGSAVIWGPILPALVVVGAVFWWSAGRASAFRPGRIGWGMRWVPGVGKILDGAIAAQFADWMALLIEHGVPWPDAVRLAAAATGDAKLGKLAARVAEAAARGEPIDESVRGVPGVPPLLAWLIGEGRDQTALATALHHAAETYRRRSLRHAQALRMTLPAVLMIAIGASVTLLYAMILFAPWSALLNGLTRAR